MIVDLLMTIDAMTQTDSAMTMCIIDSIEAFEKKERANKSGN